VPNPCQEDPVGCCACQRSAAVASGASASSLPAITKLATGMRAPCTHQQAARGRDQAVVEALPALVAQAKVVPVHHKREGGWWRRPIERPGP